MKNKKLKMILLSAAMTTCLLGGCANTQGIQTPTTQQPVTKEPDMPNEPEPTMMTVNPVVTADAEPEITEQGSQFSFADISDLEFCFESGAGAWCTVLEVNKDGTFRGEYHDSDMGDTGEGYPEGIHYLCDFTGKFTEPKKVDAYTYSVEIESIEYEQEAGTEEIIDGRKFVYSEPYGLDDAKEILIYLPGVLTENLPEEYISWIPVYGDVIETELPFYGLFNVKAGEGFYSYENVSSISEELDNVEEEAATLEKKLEEAMTQLEMNVLTSEIYQLWDKELNRIWNQLKETLDAEIMDSLTKEEKEWITYKEDEIKKAGQEFEGGTMQPLAECNKGAELTKKRVYELAEYLS